MRYLATGTLRCQALQARTRKPLRLAPAVRARAGAAAGAATGRAGRLRAMVWQAAASKCGQTAAPARRRRARKAGTPPRAAAALPAAARRATVPSRHTGGPSRAGWLGCGAAVRLSAGDCARSVSRHNVLVLHRLGVVTGMGDLDGYQNSLLVVVIHPSQL
jgi:hypothetical protein